MDHFFSILKDVLLLNMCVFIGYCQDSLNTEKEN